MFRDRDSIDQVMATRETLTKSPPQRRGAGPFRTLLAAALAVASVFASTAVRAEGKSAFLAEQLRKNTDFRVRVDAALKLGTSDDPEAVKPLCACLDDGSEVETVRVTCAAALGKLKKPGGDTCLKEHSSDKSSKVREQVTTSLKALGGTVAAPVSSTGPACLNSAATGKPKYYVGVLVKNKTGRPDSDIKAMVEQAILCKLQSLGRFKLTVDTDPAKMAKVASSDKLDGYYLLVQVEPFVYQGGNLTVGMKITMMTHTRDLKGELGKTLTVGASSPSKMDEDDLIKLAATKLTDDFAKLKP